MDAINDEVDEAEEVKAILHARMHPEYHDVERQIVIAQARQMKLTPMLAKLLVALEDAHERLSTYDDEVDAAYRRGYAEAEVDFAEERE